MESCTPAKSSSASGSYRVRAVEAQIFHKFLGGHRNRMTEASKIIFDKTEAHLVEIETNAGNVSEDDNDLISPSLESIDEGEAENFSDDNENGQATGIKERLAAQRIFRQ